MLSGLGVKSYAVRLFTDLTVEERVGRILMCWGHLDHVIFRIIQKDTAFLQLYVADPVKFVSQVEDIIFVFKDEVPLAIKRQAGRVVLHESEAQMQTAGVMGGSGADKLCVTVVPTVWVRNWFHKKLYPVGTVQPTGLITYGVTEELANIRPSGVFKDGPKKGSKAGMVMKSWHQVRLQTTFLLVQ